MNGTAGQFNSLIEPVQPAGLCPICGMSPDSQHFDVSSIVPVPPHGRKVVLASFALPPQFCGVFENFSQFTDLSGRSQANARTPGLHWTVLVNNRPLHPYLDLEHIINPWGYGSFMVRIRLDLDAKVELVVRNEACALDPNQNEDESRWRRAFIHLVGGRIVGRYWYNPAYGDASCRRHSNG
jgi:hypothetical protein